MKTLIFLVVLIFLNSSISLRTRRQINEEIISRLGDNPRDQLAKMVLSRKGDRFEGGKDQAEYLLRIENYLAHKGEGLEDPDDEWLAMARQRAREGRLRLGRSIIHRAIKVRKIKRR